MLRQVQKTLIVLFVLWHCVAIAAYSVSDDMAELPGFHWIHEHVYAHTRPYILGLSLWQRWPLFAPDPLRRVIVYDIEAWQHDAWRTVQLIGPEHTKGFHTSSKLKLMRRLNSNTHQRELRERLAQRACTLYNLPIGTSLRLTRHHHVIPKHDSPQSISWWRQWEPEWITSHILETTCPDTPIL